MTKTEPVSQKLSRKLLFATFIVSPCTSLKAYSNNPNREILILSTELHIPIFFHQQHHPASTYQHRPKTTCNNYWISTQCHTPATTIFYPTFPVDQFLQQRFKWLSNHSGKHHWLVPSQYVSFTIILYYVANRILLCSN